MRLRYRFRFYPTDEQAKSLVHVFGCCRYVYNFALRLRADSYQVGKTLNYNASSAALTALKSDKDHSWLNDVSCVPLQQALRHLQTAFKHFFKKRAAYPAFKKKRSKQSAEYTRSAFKWNAESRTLTVAKLGKLKIRWSRTFTSNPTTVTITKDTIGRYFVTFSLDELIEPMTETGESVGVDLGVAQLATLSTGERIQNPRHFNKWQHRLARAQRVLSRRQKGSKRREKARLRAAKIQAHIADARRDYLHKVTTSLVRRFDAIYMEDLNVRGMVRNSRLARSLSDASFFQFRQMVAYKCDWYGKKLKLVDRFFPSSKRCHICGHVIEALPLSVREWCCPECNTRHDRDENAAHNILTAGHAAVNARGGTVRPDKAAALTGKSRRTANHLSCKDAPHSSHSEIYPL